MRGEDTLRSVRKSVPVALASPDSTVRRGREFRLRMKSLEQRELELLHFGG